MTGLRGLLLTSATGAKFTCTPIARPSTAVMRPASNASRSSPVAPSAIARGKRVAPAIRMPAPYSKSAVASSGTDATACNWLRVAASDSGCPSTTVPYPGFSRTCGDSSVPPNAITAPAWLSRMTRVSLSNSSLSVGR